MILAGDIGGTKAMLMLARVRRGSLEPVFESRYAVAAFADIEALLARFFGDYRQQGGRRARLSTPCSRMPSSPRATSCGG